MVNQHVPQWLQRALDEYPDTGFPRKRAENSPAQVGEIRLAKPISGRLPSGLSQTLALVMPDVAPELGAPDCAVVICLLSAEVWEATDTDCVMKPEETGLPFEVFVALAFRTSIWERQLEPVLGEVDEELFAKLSRAATTYDFTQIGWERRGTPLHGREDPRWQFHSQLGDVARSLQSGVAAAIFSSDEP